MSIIERMRKQKAAYWPVVGTDSSGQPVHGDPIEVKCRWEGVNELFIDPSGEQAVSNAKVYVDREMDLGGLLKQGPITGLVSVQPFKNTEVYTIRKVDEIPNLRATRFLRSVML